MNLFNTYCRKIETIYVWELYRYSRNGTTQRARAHDLTVRSERETRRLTVSRRMSPITLDGPVRAFLTEAEPPQAEWRPYPLLLRRGGEGSAAWKPPSCTTAYELLGKILVAFLRVPNPASSGASACPSAHTYRVLQDKISAKMRADPTAYGLRADRGCDDDGVWFTDDELRRFVRGVAVELV